MTNLSEIQFLVSKDNELDQLIETLTEHSIRTSPFRVGQETIPSTNLAQASCELAEGVRGLSLDE